MKAPTLHLLPATYGLVGSDTGAASQRREPDRVPLPYVACRERRYPLLR